MHYVVYVSESSMAARLQSPSKQHHSPLSLQRCFSEFLSLLLLLLFHPSFLLLLFSNCAPNIAGGNASQTDLFTSLHASRGVRNAPTLLEREKKTLSTNFCGIGTRTFGMKNWPFSSLKGSTWMDIAFDASSLVPLKKEVQGCEVTRSSSSSSFKLRCTQAALQTLWAAGMQAKRSKAGTQQKKGRQMPRQAEREDKLERKKSWQFSKT